MRPSASASPDHPAFTNKVYDDNVIPRHVPPVYDHHIETPATPSAPPLPPGQSHKNETVPLPKAADSGLYLDLLPQNGMAVSSEDNVYSELRNQGPAIPEQESVYETLH